ncbi:TMV resistance protein N-like [Rosa rugosa]|uniref:TMV resistance protein N-like n=1 Tax=Rosa rugosa TaxID=74645 RepID=UPI002B412B40|nr:TMV resistance protein N-like [Rosa rugosa]
MAAASSRSDIIPRERYDVFLSFRGEDTRNTFTSHLYEALRQKKIQTYIDYKLERGDEIAPALLEAISESKLSVIIFSKNYASSTWCLDELVHILECRDKQSVIPIFYGVDPSDVRKQLGSYADAFVEHEKRFKDPMDKVLRWRKALKTAANISGFDSQTIRPESELVKWVVNDILAKLDCKPQNAGGLEGRVGMDKHIIQLVELLCLNSPDVQIVGIWGMGGIGKTTIADVVFHRLSFQFEACCFIKYVREKASETKHGLPYDLRNELFRTLLKDENICIYTPSIGSAFMRDRLRRTKALIVLDDVSEFSQLEFLAGGDFNLFGPGSRILVTTRNKRIFRNGDEIYEVKKLDVDEALELFYSRAFRNISPPDDCTTFVKEVVDYAGGNPLALKILAGVFHHCKSKEDWEGELDKLKKFPDEDIQKVLRFSYDGLRENEKEIFLDIACCHKGKHIDEAKRILYACGFSANAGVRLLIDMALISVDEDSRLVEMHDLIQEMGWEIVRDECVKDPGKRSRLWLANEVRHVLKNNTGTEHIECIVMNMDLITDFYVNAASFEKMPYLRLLDLYTRGVNKVHLPPGFEFLPEALKYLRWDSYPLTSLPSRFSSENLVELDMPNSRLEQLWNKGVQINLGSLKRIVLSWSHHLAEVPDLSESPHLESISLRGCTSLVQLPSSFQHLAKLTLLDLSDCSNLKILPEMLNSLRVLRLYGCLSLESLPIELPYGLTKLYLSNCESLRSLPVELPSGLERLELCNCKSLGSLPVELPSGLKELDLEHCESLWSLPVELPPGLEYLDLSDCESLGSLPVELPPGLLKLDLSNCKRLGSLPVELPSGLERLELCNCNSLGSLPVKLPSGLKELDLENCVSLWSLPVMLPPGLLKLDLRNCKSLESLPVELPPGLLKLDFSNCKSLESLPVELPPGLLKLDFSNCQSLESLPVELPAGLRTMYLRNCKSLRSLPKLPWPLIGLDAHGCTSLERVSSMRTAPIQGRDQYVNNSEELWPEDEEGLSFINCLKLDQSARSNIMADAQLRVMRIAIASRLLNKSFWINIVCPGNEIPKWMRYQSEGCRINIKLPPHWFRQGFLGYALCIVLAFNYYTPPDTIYSNTFSCETHLKINNGHEDWCETLQISLPDILNSDHVFVWYFYPKSFGLESAINREDGVKASEASFDFILYKHTYENGQYPSIEKNPFDLSTVRVKRCGVSLLYEDATVDEDVVMEPKQVVEKEEIIIKTRRRRDQCEPCGSGFAILKEEDDGELLPQSIVGLQGMKEGLEALRENDNGESLQFKSTIKELIRSNTSEELMGNEKATLLITVTTSKVDHTSTFQSVADGETIGSTGGTFELGFFSPGSSATRYVGIWYKKISVTTVVWVANIDTALTDSLRSHTLEFLSLSAKTTAQFGPPTHQELHRIQWFSLPTPEIQL